LLGKSENPCRQAKMRRGRSERAAGERPERRVRGEGASVMRDFSERGKITMAHFDIIENENHRIFKLRKHSRSALAAMRPEAAWGGKRLRDRVLRRANRP
jgi:hypothetical protein